MMLQKVVHANQNENNFAKESEKSFKTAWYM